MASKIILRQGLKKDLPTLDNGEIGFCTDTKEIFIGSLTGNVLIGKDLITLSRLGISNSNKLTIDGVEFTNGSSIQGPAGPQGPKGDTGTQGPQGIQGPQGLKGDPGNGILVFNTLSNLQATYPNGVSQPVWVIADNDWYYWNGIITDTVPPTITVSPAAGMYNTNQSITLTANEPSTIYYTLDNTTPTTSSTIYSGPITISSTTTLQFFGKDAAGNSSIIQSITYTIDKVAPNNVTNLSPTNTSATALTLNWTASTSSDIASYDIYNGATLIGNVTGTSYDVSGLTANTNYTFTVKAKDAVGNTSTGTSINITTSSVVDTTPPNNVTGLTAGTATINSIPISWTLSSSNDVANYEVAYSTGGAYTVASAVINSSSTSYVITGLAASTNYTIRVVAIDTAGNRSTDVTTTKTTAASISYTVSASPSSGTYNATQNVILSVSPSGATIYYTIDGSTPTTSSTVYSSAIAINANTTIKFFAQDGVGNVTSVQTANYTIDTTAPTVTISPSSGTYNSTQSITITSNETSTIYYTIDGTSPTTSSTIYSTPISVSSTETIKYLAVDTAGNQTTGSATYTIDTTPPDSVTALAVGTVTSNSIPVTWTAPTAVDVSKYEVAYSSDGGTNYTLATSSLSTPATSYTVTGLTASTTYTIRVVAIDGAGNRSTPTTVSTTTGISAIIVSSTFDGANSTTTLGTSNTGQPWTSLTGTWGVSNNKAYLVSGTSNNIAYVDAGKVDVSVSTDITWGNSGGLALRVVDANNFILLRINTTAVQLYKLVTGTATLLKSYNFTPVSGQIYNLRADLRGSTITCYLNNAQIFEGYCTAFDTATKYGFKQNATTTDLYDNFTVQSIPSTATVASGYAVYDSFDRADSTTTLGVADTGQSWTPLVGTWGISANRAYQVTNTTGGALASAVIESGKSDAEISVVFNEYVEYGLIFRATDANNYLFVRYSSTSAEWQMFKTVSGTSTKIGNLAATVTDGTPFKLKVITSQTSLQFFVDDVSQFTVTDSFNQTATKHGIRGATTAASCYYDNFTIK